MIATSEGLIGTVIKTSGAGNASAGGDDPGDRPEGNI